MRMTNGWAGIAPEAISAVAQAEQALIQAGVFARMEEVALKNQMKVMEALQENRVEARHFASSTGYGYDDIGRDTLDRVYAQAFGAEAALVRPQMINGTHALALALYGVLRPGDVLLSVTGKPYDTLEEVIGLAGDPDQGSLKDFGVRYEQLELTASGSIDLEKLAMRLEAGEVRMVYLQRSKGYDWRPTMSMDQLTQVTELVHQIQPRALVMVDNCYGEFVEDREPTDVGANLMAGSLIKNPGGGLAPTGGYVAGDAALIAQVACRLTTPGIGAEAGSYAGGYQYLFQGFFLAPHVVLQSLKTAALMAYVLKARGYDTIPAWDEPRYDIIQAVRLGSRENLEAFCRAIQAASPVDGHVVPEPWPMPGYQHDVIMAAGTFVQGASIELSADGPIKPPYVGYMQGALTYEHGKLAAMRVLTALK